MLLDVMIGGLYSVIFFYSRAFNNFMVLKFLGFLVFSPEGQS